LVKQKKPFETVSIILAQSVANPQEWLTAKTSAIFRA
jgi:hypothetical protein